MSAAEDLLHDLAEYGVTVWQEAGQLCYRAPAGAMTPELLINVRQHKPELLVLLAANDHKIATRSEPNFRSSTRARARQRAQILPSQSLPLVLTFELDDGLATCIDPVSSSLADAVADIQRQFPGRVGRLWRNGQGGCFRADY